MQSLLLTGINGFIGSHAAAHFKAQYKITGLDRDPADRTHCADSYFKSFLPSPDLAALVRRVKPCVCIHCAGPASVPLSFEDPEGDFQSGPAALMNLLEAIRKEAPGCFVVFPSSAAVYGNPDRLPVRENAPLLPISPYGHHKTLCERLLTEYRDLHGIRSAALRIFSCYGPGLRKQLLWDIACQIKEKGEIMLSGTGRETRDFIYVKDVVRAMECAIKSFRKARPVYNVATGLETTVREVALAMAERFSLAESSIRFSGKARKGDPRRWRADITALKNLGFSPETGFKTGILQYRRWIDTAVR